MRLLRGALVAATAMSLTGCLPMVAANVAGSAVNAARGQPTSNEGFGELARDVCTARAEPYGAVHIIDTEQHTPSTIIVWGTVGSNDLRKSFKCTYGTKITSFTLRAIAAQH
jgi:hypothetical protein